MDFKRVIFLVAVLVGFTIFVPGNANAAKIGIVYGVREKMIKVGDFPDTDSFKTSDDHYFDPGYKFKQFHIFSIPLWNSEEQWCGYIDDEYYVNLTRSELLKYAAMVPIKIPDKVSLPFWDQYGGKLLAALILILFIIYLIRDDEKPNNQKENDEEIKMNQDVS